MSGEGQGILKVWGLMFARLRGFWMLSGEVDVEADFCLGWVILDDSFEDSSFFDLQTA